jgi:hypothetical protein
MRKNSDFFGPSESIEPLVIIPQEGRPNQKREREKRDGLRKKKKTNVEQCEF